MTVGDPVTGPKAGDGPPILEMTPGIEDAVRWAAAADDYTSFHFDPDAARRQGFEGPVVHGTFQAALAVRMIRDWLGPDAAFIDLECRYRQPAIVGTPLRCSAMVTRIEDRTGGIRRAWLEVVVESPRGRPVTTGTAVIDISVGPRAAHHSTSGAPG